METNGSLSNLSPVVRVRGLDKHYGQGEGSCARSAASSWR
jgi:hypothetical protein